MPTSTGIHWVTPPGALAQAIEQYGDRVLVAITAVAGRIASIMEASAKNSAPWTDRTGNARSGIFGTAERDVAERLVTIYLSHGPAIDYGVWLELANSGRYSIIMQTIEAHLEELRADLQAIFG